LARFNTLAVHVAQRIASRRAGGMTSRLGDIVAGRRRACQHPYLYRAMEGQAYAHHYRYSRAKAHTVQRRAAPATTPCAFPAAASAFLQRAGRAAPAGATFYCLLLRWRSAPARYALSTSRASCSPCWELSLAPSHTMHKTSLYHSAAAIDTRCGRRAASQRALRQNSFCPLALSAASQLAYPPKSRNACYAYQYQRYHATLLAAHH